MHLQPREKILKEKKLVGQNVIMSLVDNKTGQLWRNFMPRRSEIFNSLSTELISMKVYNEPLVLGDLKQKFEKWAAVEVSDFNHVPNEMKTFTLRGGLHAIFDYKGLSTDNDIFIHIFKTWLPGSNYVLDDRPQFEVLGDRYKNGYPNSEEEIWIPIKPK